MSGIPVLTSNKYILKIGDLPTGRYWVLVKTKKGIYKSEFIKE
jgi:hypothetical protein